jgi:hypothetical protein
MHKGTTIHELSAKVNHVLNLDTANVDTRLTEIEKAFAQVQRDMLLAKTPNQYYALAILEFSLLAESTRLRSERVQ